tara:strand:- start:433 stop:648 length:216 start_codon:yes stop_codon:yes gene_type:complete
MASIIITVSPFFIFFPTSANFFPPGSAERYAVPTIGLFTIILSDKSISSSTKLSLVLISMPFNDFFKSSKT